MPKSGICKAPKFTDEAKKCKFNYKKLVGYSGDCEVYKSLVEDNLDVNQLQQIFKGMNKHSGVNKVICCSCQKENGIQGYAELCIEIKEASPKEPFKFLQTRKIDFWDKSQTYRCIFQDGKCYIVFEEDCDNIDDEKIKKIVGEYYLFECDIDIVGKYKNKRYVIYHVHQTKEDHTGEVDVVKAAISMDDNYQYTRGNKRYLKLYNYRYFAT